MTYSRTQKAGFTLVELIVVVIIIGILVSVGIPQYTKTVESSKATDAAAQLQLIAGANRMFALDHSGKYASGTIDTTCNDYGCPTTCNGTSPNGCCLVGCKYLASQDWSAKPWTFTAVGSGVSGCTGSWSACSGSTALVNAAACAKRKTSGNGSTNVSPYNTWGYLVDRNGIAYCAGTEIPPPPS